MASPSIQEIAAILGQPVAGNPMQFMMERSFGDAGLDWRYLTLEVTADALKDAVAGMRAMGFRGANITRPHKLAVAPLVDRLADSALRAGAVNCIVREDAELVGHNTDGTSFVLALKEVLDPAGKAVVILGSGGAARAIAVELAAAGAAKITVADRDEARAQAAAAQVSGAAAIDHLKWSGSFEVPRGTDVVVHTTSLGLRASDPRVPLAMKSLKPTTLVADLNLNPPETRLLREARERGCRILSGHGVLIEQAAAAFKMWTGQEADRTVLGEAIEEFLGF